MGYNMSKLRHLSLDNSFSEFLIYTTPNGKVKIEVFIRDENIWLTQDKIASLFCGKDAPYSIFQISRIQFALRV